MYKYCVENAGIFATHSLTSWDLDDSHSVERSWHDVIQISRLRIRSAVSVTRWLACSSLGKQCAP